MTVYMSTFELLQFCGLLGSSLPVFAYGSVWEMTHSLSASTLTGLFFAFGLYLSNNYVVSNQIVLLDKTERK